MRGVVLSGASRGLGAALLTELVRAGDRVLALARSAPAPDARLDRVTWRECDVSNPDSLPTVDDLRHFLDGSEDVILINNAATTEPIGAVGRLASVALRNAILTNLAGPALLTNAFLAALAVDEAGSADPLTLRPGLSRAHIVFVTSSVARRAKPGTAAYCAAKAGGEMFFEALRAEVSGESRIAVTIFDPGGMDTDMHRTIRTSESYLPDRERLRQVAAAGGLPGPDVVARRFVTEHLPAAGR